MPPRNVLALIAVVIVATVGIVLCALTDHSAPDVLSAIALTALGGATGVSVPAIAARKTTR